MGAVTTENHSHLGVLRPIVGSPIIRAEALKQSKLKSRLVRLTNWKGSLIIR